MVNNDVQPLVKMFPSTGICQREIRIDQSGKPILCQNKAYAKIENGPALCLHHLEEAMQIVETSLLPSAN